MRLIGLAILALCSIGLNAHLLPPAHWGTRAVMLVLDHGRSPPDLRVAPRLRVAPHLVI
jgi:hypothetical protein